MCGAGVDLIGMIKIISNPNIRMCYCPLYRPHIIGRHNSLRVVDALLTFLWTHFSPLARPPPQLQPISPPKKPLNAPRRNASRRRRRPPVKPAVTRPSSNNRVVVEHPLQLLRLQRRNPSKPSPYRWSRPLKHRRSRPLPPTRSRRRRNSRNSQRRRSPNNSPRSRRAEMVERNRLGG